MENQYTSEYGHASGLSQMALGFLAGLVAGSAAAMIFAPYSGPETRRRLRDGIATGKERAGEWMEAGKRKLTQEARRFDSAFHAGKEAYQRHDAGVGTPTGM